MKQYSLWSNYRFAYEPLWKHKKRLLVVTVAEAVFVVFVPIVGMAVTSMIVGSLERGTPMRELVCQILAAFVGYGILSMIKGYLEARGGEQYIEARTEFFIMQEIEKDLSVSMEQYEDSSVHTLKEKADYGLWSNDYGIEGFFRHNSDLLKNALGLFVYALIVGTMNWKILAMLVGMSAVSAAAAYWVTRYYHKIKDQLAVQNMAMGYINREVDDIQGGKDIRIFGLGSWIIGKYDAAIRSYRQLCFGRSVREYGSDILDRVLDAARDGICYLYLITQLSQGMAVSHFVFYLGLVGGFSNWIALLSKSAVAVKQDSDMVGDQRAYLDLAEESMAGTQDCAWDAVEVVFDHVSYRYRGASEDTLKDVSFRLAAGEKLALVGVNGAGKTTIVKLMAGLYLPTAGTVYVNGVSTRALDREAYFARQAAIFQEPFQTSFTIGENIALAEKEDAAYDAGRLWEVIRQAGLDKKVEGLDAQLDTYLGKDIAKDGIALSGGEMQKLLLARALYRDAFLVMLDEPTAALDALAETEIYEKYHTLLADKTVLFISHRLASTRFCDRIILLAQGRICEEGPHEELMRRQGDYYEMFQVQSRYYQDGGKL
ncbi:MAG: ABC transporter ATP-binding protein/permease [Lachnospiraceae bacterium]|nr:ABC transporter ATP-binding protein/permease [Lachnospiraceae bacterium]